MPDFDYDAVIVGSGFGGAVTAYNLAEAGLRICILERGALWPPGSFPRYPREFRDAVFDPSRGRLGLFNLWSFRNIDVLTAAGVGGGSLVYANVLLRKDPASFVREDGLPWPLSYADLEPHYERIEELLEVRTYPGEIQGFNVPRHVAVRRAATEAGLENIAAPLAVAFGHSRDARPEIGTALKNQANLHGVRRESCRLCGECDVGCNYGSKHTLDLNLLSRAVQLGAELRPLCQAITLRPDANGYAVEYVEHCADQSVHSTDLDRHTLRTRQLILAAGSPASPYLLLRNREHFPNLSPRLGERFAGNGDLLGFVTSTQKNLDAYHGPVITSVVQSKDRRGEKMYVEDAGVPNFLAFFVEGLLSSRSWTLWNLLRFFGRYLVRIFSLSRSPNLGSVVGDSFGRGTFSATMLPLLGMGRDIPDGRLFLKKGKCRSDWSPRSSRRFFRDLRNVMRRLAARLGGRFRPNPVGVLGRTITVHPLGGCVMGRSPEEGVVDVYGEVFGYSGLFVVDGSVMPGPVGANPALSIAATADHCSAKIILNFKNRKVNE